MVGQGGVGVVRRVHEANLNRSVAMKRPKASATPETAAALIEEARSMASLDHPGVVPIYELGVDPTGNPFFTMKIAQGETLRQRLNRLPPEERSRDDLYRLIEVLMKVCDTLAYAHGKGVVHRDVKPENVVLGDYGEVTLLDWGLATPLAGSDAASERSTPDPARPPGVGLHGTPAYMPPEVARGLVDEIDQRTDVFMVGALLCEVLTGTPPFHCRDAPTSYLRARAYSPVVDPETARPIVGRLVDIAQRAMAESPSDRFDTISDLKSELERFLRGGTLLEQRRYEQGALVIKEGDPGEEAFIIAQGECVAFHAADGVTLTTMGAGETFGEVALFAETPRTASVRARTDTTVMVLRREDLLAGVGEGSWLSILITTLARRYAEKDQRVRELEELLRAKGG
jgi:serine/threonine-protein kinase